MATCFAAAVVDDHELVPVRDPVEPLLGHRQGGLRPRVHVGPVLNQDDVAGLDPRAVELIRAHQASAPDFDGKEAESLRTWHRALKALDAMTPEVVLLDLGLPPSPETASEGLKALDELLKAAPGAKVIVLTGNTERDNAVASIRQTSLLGEKFIDLAPPPSGARGRLIEISDRFLIVEAAGKLRRIPFTHLDRIDVCEPKELALAPGDRLQLKANAKTTDGRPSLAGGADSGWTVAEGPRYRCRNR